VIERVKAEVPKDGQVSGARSELARRRHRFGLFASLWGVFFAIKAPIPDERREKTGFFWQEFAT